MSDIRYSGQSENADSHEHAPSAAGSVQVVWDNHDPCKEDGSIEFEWRIETAYAPVEAYVERQSQTKRESPKQIGSIGDTEAMTRQE